MLLSLEFLVLTVAVPEVLPYGNVQVYVSK